MPPPPPSSSAELSNKRASEMSAKKSAQAAMPAKTTNTAETTRSRPSHSTIESTRPPPPKKPPPPLSVPKTDSKATNVRGNLGNRQKSFAKSSTASAASDERKATNNHHHQGPNAQPTPNKQSTKANASNMQPKSGAGVSGPVAALRKEDQVSKGNFQRQRSFMSPSSNHSERANKKDDALLNVPGQQHPTFQNSGKSSPRFKRTRTISCIETTGLLNKNRGGILRNRNSNSISDSSSSTATMANGLLNPGAKEFVMKKEVPGMPPQKTAKLTDSEKNMICEAMQPPNFLMKSKARILIDTSDVLLQSVLKEHLMPSDAALIVTKILEADPNYTFVESLMNSCQECYHQKIASTGRQVNVMAGEANAFVLFLAELYQVLKRKQWLLDLEPNPSLVLLQLLSDYCQQVLLNLISDNGFGTSCSQLTSRGSGNQMDFFTRIFTTIGREMSRSARLSELTCHLRDVFLSSHSPILQDDDSSREKLLHLIELQSADWQLSPEAIAYYYPITTIVQ